MIPDGWDFELREAALTTARHLLEADAVAFDEVHPFTLKSGLFSPIHIDCRRLLSFPEARTHIVDWAVRMVEREIGEAAIEAIAAGEGAGVPFATLIADRLGLPLLYVRRTVPTSPRKQQVEGVFRPGARVLLIEQLAVDGLRKADFARALQEAGARVEDIFVIFQYGIFDALHEHLAPYGLTLHALATWWDLLEVATRERSLEEHVIREIHAYLAHPARWSSQNRQL